MKKDNFGAWVITMILMFIFSPFICYWLGYLSGILVVWLVGDNIVAGLSYLGLNVTVHQIPVITGTLSVLGGYLGRANTSFDK